MNSDKKESIAITAIINEVNQFDNLQENLKKKEKEPVWDGELTLYQAQSNKSNEIMGRIPVQVKGIGQEADKKEKTLDYRVKISDIENYKKDKKGAIFFVVEVFENRETAIYYKIFDLETIDNILNAMTTKQITKKFEFKRLEKNELVSICIDFMDKLNVYESIVPIKKVEVYDKQILCYNYNTKYELEEMKKANEVFYETNAYREAKEKLEQQNVIILHGEPWVGKTSTARKLVMNYIEQGYLFLYGNVDDLVDIKNKVAIEGKMICLIDDFLGSNVQYLEKNVAESTLDKIISIFKNSKDKKLILTSRTYIYNNCKQLFYKFYHATGIKDEYLIDVADYNYLEKGSILYNHLQKNNLLGTTQYEQILEDEFYEDIIEHDNFNPGVISLICERMKNQQIPDIKEYIREVLKDPERLWEEEYQKLTPYEKMILIIIVLFGVKVCEDYVKEQFDQIVENEQIKLIEDDIFYRALDKLTLSFIRVTFDENEERQLEVCKHSIADYIISKIRKEQIHIERYIKSAKYVEVLHYINIIINDSQDEVRELLAKKVEEDFGKIEGFYYEERSILYHILEKKVTDKREDIMKQIVIDAFVSFDINFILSILETERNTLYDFTLEKFKKYIIDRNDEEYLYHITYITDYEEYLQICLKILNYQKNSEYFMVNLEDIKESLIDVVSQDIESTIEDLTMENVAEDIIKGQKLEQIKMEYIDAAVYDETPSLLKAYSKGIHKEILETLHECCYIHIDKNILQETILSLKNKAEKSEDINRKNDLMETEEMQRKYIQEKFEKELIKQPKKESEKEYWEFAREINFKVGNQWWLDSFVNRYINDYWHNCHNYPSLILYREFTEQRKEIDDSLSGFAKQFLEYIYQKHDISKKEDKILREMIHNNFVNGEYEIKSETIEAYEVKCPRIMEKLYETKLIVKEVGGYYFLNEYIYFYIALQEVKQREEELLTIMFGWIEKRDEIETEHFMDKSQEIFQLYSELDRVKFNQRCAILLLRAFIHIVQTKARSNGKMGIARAMIDIFSIEIELSEEFDINGSFGHEYIFSWMIHFITGMKLESKIGWFDYSIYQEVLYRKCFDIETGGYQLNFKKILRDKILRGICSKLGIWDYLYDVYLACIEVVENLQKNPEIDIYHIAQKRLEEKYDI